MRFGPYESSAVIGRGGAGTVLRARDAAGREVAIKVLAKRGGDAVARFEREMRLLRTLGDAEGFVPLLESGASPEGLWFAMPLLLGGTLRQRLARGPLGVEETVALGVALARAIGLAHERGIVHRDLKPENVLFTHRSDELGRPLVADLGLGKHFDRAGEGGSQSVSLSVDGSFRGTAGYMAPEQVAGAKDVAATADVFALGAILYECLAGRPAFTGDTIIELLARVDAGVVEPLKRKDVPRWLEAALRTALAHEPGRRFEDGAALAGALERRGAKAPWTRGRKLLAALAVLVLLGGGATVAAVVVGRTRGPDAAALLSSATDRMQRGDFAGVIEDCTKAIERAPELGGAWRLRGHAKRSRKDFQGAIADLTRAIELDARDAQAWAGRGLVHVESGSAKPALDDAQRAVELAPNLGIARVALAGASILKGDWSGAGREAQRATELDPTLAVAWLQLGSVKHRANDLEAANEAFGKAVERDPRFQVAWQNLVIVRLALHKWQLAIDAATSAIEVTPDDPSLYANRAVGYYRLDDYDRGVADCAKALALAPSYPLALLTRASIYENHEKLDETIADLEAYIAAWPNSYEAPSVRRRLAALKTSR